MYADLHVHSAYSDGTDSPARLFELARENGLSAIAIADHDTVGGVKAAEQCDRLGVRLIPAIEVSTVCRNRFLHVLGYYIGIHSAALAEYIAWVSAEKTDNTRINFETALADGCFEYRWERVLEANAGQPRLSGVHVVKAMEADGYAVPGMTMREMFWKYFRPEGDRFTATEKATVQDAIDIIDRAGGVPVIAHPKLVYDDSIVLDMIGMGARGIEAHYPEHTAEETAKYLQMAKDYSLFITGGSDWHGDNSHPEAAHMGVTGLEHGQYPILNF